MITKRIATEIVQVSLNPITERLSERARQEMAENFCKPKCGREPEEDGFCRDAYMTYRQFLRLLFEGYASLN